jgi:signal peptidase I
MQPWWLDWTAGLFPVILVVFLLRSFLFEPFKIPSGSMIPTLLVGDLILVNKFHYGVRLPVINKKIIDNNPAARRRDGLPLPGGPAPGLHQARGRHPRRRGHLPQPDAVDQRQKVATVPWGDFYDEDSLRYEPQFSEKLGDVEHRILVNPRGRPTTARPQDLSVCPAELPLQCRGRGVQGAARATTS